MTELWAGLYIDRCTAGHIVMYSTMYIGHEITNYVVHRVQFRAASDNKLGCHLISNMHCCGFHVTVVFSDCLNSILTKWHEAKLYKCYRRIVCVWGEGGDGEGGSSVSIVTILRTRRLESLGSILWHSGDLSAHYGVQTGSGHLLYVSLRYCPVRIP